MISVVRVSLGVFIGGAALALLAFVILRLRPPQSVIFCIVIAMLVVSTEFFSRRERSELRALQASLWHGRPSYSHAEFGARFFEMPLAPIASRLRELLQQFVTVDVSQLQPTDDFMALFTAASFDPLSSGLYLDTVAEEFHLAATDTSIPAFHTFDSFIRYVFQQSNGHA